MTSPGVSSEVGRLRTVLLHRPGAELKRLTPRNNDRLLFDGIPWVDRAQEEHDAFAQVLRDRDVEVLYLVELLTETLASEEARGRAVTLTLESLHLGDTLRGYLASHLLDLAPEALAHLLCEGLRAGGLQVTQPAGTYFVIADAAPLGVTDALAFCRRLPGLCGVVGVPVSVFHDDPEAARTLVRFAFCKRDDVLHEAVSRLAALSPG